MDGKCGKAGNVTFIRCGNYCDLNNLRQDLGDNDTGLISTFTGETEEELISGRLYSITIEFRENYGAAEARLMWRSEGQPLEVSPRKHYMIGNSDVGHGGYRPHLSTLDGATYSIS